MEFLTGFCQLRNLAKFTCILAIVVQLFQGNYINQTAQFVQESFFNVFPILRRTVPENNSMTTPGHIRRRLLHISLKASVGKIISIELDNRQSSKTSPAGPSDFTSLLVRIDNHQYLDSISTPDVQFTPRVSRGPTKFVYVLGFWEQISRSLISLLDLALLHRFTQRKVITPRVNNSFMGSNGQDLLFYINVPHLNKLLIDNGVSGLMDEQVFRKECGPHSGEVNLTVHFLYNRHWNSFAVENFGRKKVRKLMKELKGKSSIDCTRNISQNKEICVNPLNVYQTNFLEADIFQNAKCVVFSEWRGLGAARFRMDLQPSTPLTLSLILQSQLEFNDNILREAKSFLKTTVHGVSFVAVQVRAERLLVPRFMAMERIFSCLEVLKETISLVKSQLGVHNVLLLTDFAKYGSGTWPEKKRKELMARHEDLVKSLNAICYHPNSQSKPFLSDRGVVALVEMTIASLSNHLVAVGRGTFQDWILAKFQKNNRGQGLLLKICSKAGHNT